ncbi:MAG: hypothetical protein DI538_25555 [Azospira oryzae]|nr:MAG: hypothetical protein DI538_25555 [Azospira oryzae]
MPTFNMPSKETIRKYVLLVVVCTLLGISFYVYIHYSSVGQLPSLKLKLEKYLLAIALTNIIGLVIVNIDMLLDRLIHWRSYFLLRFLTGFIVNTLLSIGMITGVIRFFALISQDEALKLGILLVISVFIYEIFYGWFYSYRYYGGRW